MSFPTEHARSRVWCSLYQVQQVPMTSAYTRWIQQSHGSQLPPKLHQSDSKRVRQGRRAPGRKPERTREASRHTHRQHTAAVLSVSSGSGRWPGSRLARLHPHSLHLILKVGPRGPRPPACCKGSEIIKASSAA